MRILAKISEFGKYECFIGHTFLKVAVSLRCVEQPIITVGLSIVLSGPASIFITDIKFANSEIVKDKYEIIIEDNKCEEPKW